MWAQPELATPKQLHECTATQLAAMLGRREISSRELVEALQRRTDEVEGKVGAFAVQFRSEALAMADEIDAARQRGEKLAQLAGIPFSIKENIGVAGRSSTLGLRGHNETQRDAVVVALLREAGAVFLGHTNVPQALGSGVVCDNPRYGSTRNPWNYGHGPGGSSGGEAAAVASGSSVLGIGTDLGGSIRTPAAFCGVCGFRPTDYRISDRGLRPVLAGQEVVRPQCGPIARSVDDLILLMSGLEPKRHNELDGRVPPVPFIDPSQIDLSRLRVGYYESDGFVAPSAACVRAAREAREVLLAAGVDVVDYPLKRQDEIVALLMAAFSADGGHTVRRLLGDDSPETFLRGTLMTARIPPALRPVVSSALQRAGEPRLAYLIEAIGRRPVADYWALVAERDRLSHTEHRELCAQGIDALLGPATASAAPPRDGPAIAAGLFGYTGRFNVLGMPAGVVPVTRVRTDDRVRENKGDRFDRALAAIERRAVGLPVGIQVAARPWHDHIALALMRAIEHRVRAAPHFPTTPIDPR